MCMNSETTPLKDTLKLGHLSNMTFFGIPITLKGNFSENFTHAFYSINAKIYNRKIALHGLQHDHDCVSKKNIHER